MSTTAADAVARRHRAILDLARRTGSVTVEELATQLAVTPQTVRKDLNLLARRSMLSRVHGGAVVTSGVDNIAHAERRLVSAGPKAAIGAAAAALVPDGASLFLTVGTTTEAIARHLTAHRDLMIVTNNLNVVDILADVPSIAVVVAGGRVRPTDRAVVGALAMEFMRGFKVDVALIGASAIDLDGSLLDFDVDEVHVLRTIIRQARQVVLALDSSKVGRPAPVRIAGLDEVDVIVMDALDDPVLAAACRSAGIRVIETGA